MVPCDAKTNPCDEGADGTRVTKAPEALEEAKKDILLQIQRIGRRSEVAVEHPRHQWRVSLPNLSGSPHVASQRIRDEVFVGGRGNAGPVGSSLDHTAICRKSPDLVRNRW